MESMDGALSEDVLILILGHVLGASRAQPTESPSTSTKSSSTAAAASGSVGDLMQCALVCRSWARLALPMLWREPDLRSPRSLLLFALTALQTPPAFLYQQPWSTRDNAGGQVHQHQQRQLWCARLPTVDPRECDGRAFLPASWPNRSGWARQLSDVSRARDRLALLEWRPDSLVHARPHNQLNHDIHDETCEQGQECRVPWLTHALPRRLSLSTQSTSLVDRSAAIACRSLVGDSCTPGSSGRSECLLEWKRWLTQSYTRGFSMGPCSAADCLAFRSATALTDAELDLVLPDSPMIAPSIRGQSPLCYGHWVRFLYLDHKVIRSMITTSLLTRLLRCCSRVRRLDLTGCDQLDGDFFADSQLTCLELHAVGLAGCFRIPADLVLSLVRLSGARLQVLNLNLCSQITDTVLESLGMGCPNLLGLSLNWCSCITDSGIQSLLQPGSISSQKPDGNRSLRELSLTDCARLTDQSLLTLAACAPSLTYLRLTGCRAMSPAGLVPLVNHCRQLHYLFLARCTVNDTVLLELWQPSRVTTPTTACRSLPCIMPLRYMDLAYASDISLDAVMHVVNCCPQLESLGMGACSRILVTHPWIRSLSEPCPSSIPDSLVHDYCLLRSLSIEKLRREWTLRAPVDRPISVGH